MEASAPVAINTVPEDDEPIYVQSKLSTSNPAASLLASRRRHFNRMCSLTKAHRKMSLGLQETGTARIVFFQDYTSLQGTLVNAKEECFALTGKPFSSSPQVISDDLEILSHVKRPSQGDLQRKFSEGMVHSKSDILPQKALNVLDVPGDANSRRMNVVVIENETGLEYIIKNVTLCIKEGGDLCELRSPQINFETEETLVGNKADVELSSFMNPDLFVGEGHTVHVGSMTISFQMVTTPPDTTPSGSVGDDLDHLPLEVVPTDFLA